MTLVKIVSGYLLWLVLVAPFNLIMSSNVRDETSSLQDFDKITGLIWFQLMSICFFSSETVANCLF